MPDLTTSLETHATFPTRLIEGYESFRAGRLPQVCARRALRPETQSGSERRALGRSESLVLPVIGLAARHRRSS